MNGVTNFSPKDTGTETRSNPDAPRVSDRSRDTASASLSTSACANGRKVSPSGVSERDRVVR